MTRHKRNSLRCAHCRKWIPGDSWKCDRGNSLVAIAWGTCSGTGRAKLNSSYACRFCDATGHIIKQEFRLNEV